MGLDKVFGTAEEIETERTLETIENKQSSIDKLVVDLLAWFEHSEGTDGVEESFYNYTDYLQGYEITPKIVSRISSVLDQKGKAGVFLSALIQVSHNQGFNNFEFENVKATFFGSYLTGNKYGLIINANHLCERLNFSKAKNIIVNANQICGGWPFYKTQNFKARIGQISAFRPFSGCESFIAKIGTLSSNKPFFNAGNFTVEIEKYKGNDFGAGMHYGKVYSKNIWSLGKMRYQIFWSGSFINSQNSFHLGKMPEYIKWD